MKGQIVNTEAHAHVEVAVIPIRSHVPQHAGLRVVLLGAAQAVHGVQQGGVVVPQQGLHVRLPHGPLGARVQQQHEVQARRRVPAHLVVHQHHLQRVYTVRLC